MDKTQLSEWPERDALTINGVPGRVIDSLWEAREILQEGHHPPKYLRLLTLLVARSALDDDLADMWKYLARQRIEVCEFTITCLIHAAAEPAEEIKSRRFLQTDDEHKRVPHRELQLREAILYLSATRATVNALRDLLIESDIWLDNNFYENGMFDQSVIDLVTEAADGIAPHLMNLDNALSIVQNSFRDPKNNPANAHILIGARSGRAPHNVYVVYCVLLILEWCKQWAIHLPDCWPCQQSEDNNKPDFDYIPHLKPRHFRGLKNTFYPFTDRQIADGKDYDVDDIAELLADIQGHVQLQLNPGKTDEA